LLVHAIKLMQIFHAINFDCVPTRFEERPNENIRSRGLLLGQCFDDSLNFLFRIRKIQVMEMLRFPS
jgi:hypothetical protein